MNFDNWTQTPNFILDNMAYMKPAVFKVCMVVVRQTCGYIDKQGNRKEWDKLSTSRIMELAGLSNRAVIDAVEEAIADGWIERRPTGQYFEYRVAPMTKADNPLVKADQAYEKSSQKNEKTYENSSQATSENSSQVDPTYEKSSQEPMNFFHTQKEKRKKNNIPANQAESDSPPVVPVGKTKTKKRKQKPEDSEPTSPDQKEWFGAICWLAYAHKDYDLLSKEEKLAIGKTVKEIRESPKMYTIDDLRAWYRDIWSNEWPGKQQGKSEVQRPSFKQIKSGIGRTKAKSASENGFNASTEKNKSIALAGELER